jgi:hypothetical protein
MIVNNIILSTAYLPPIDYMAALIHANKIFLEQYENYSKQSYRNRCILYAANGILPLSVPVELATYKKITIKDVRIDNRETWQKQHFRSIESAYRTSPFFDYLIDDFIPLYSKAQTFLFDFNLSLLHILLDILQTNKSIELTTDYEHNPLNANDLRNAFHPKKETNNTDGIMKYPQVFDAKFGFIPNLSCVDLIFNLGPSAFSYLIGEYP